MKKFIEILASVKDLPLICNLSGTLYHVGSLPNYMWKKGDPLEVLMPKELALKIKKSILESQETGEIKKVLYEGVDSTNKIHSIRIICLYPPESHDQYGICLFQDITKSREFEEQNLKFTKAIEQSAHSVIITKLDGIVEYVNQNFLKNSGHTLEEVIGHRISDKIRSGVHNSEFYKKMWEALNKTDTWSGEFCNRKKNGELYWEQATISAVRDESGKLINYISIQSDITEQKKSIWELEKSKTYSEKLNRILGFALDDAKKARLESDNANKAKSDFLANMSHEIRTPMNSLVGMIDLFRETTLSESQKKYLDIMDRSGQMLLNLINDVLDLSRIESGIIELNYSFFNLEEIIDTTLEITGTKAHQKGLELICDIKTPVNFIIQSDPIRLRQVLLNLVSNAVKFTDTGNVTLSVNTEEKDNEIFIIFKIIDTGIGIPEEKMGLLFQKFSQVSNSPEKLYGGSGLGLVITKKIVEKMDGNVCVESTYKKGSIFTIKIPIKDFRKKCSISNQKLHINLGLLNKKNQEILSNNLLSEFPNAIIKTNEDCCYLKSCLHCRENEICDFIIIECEINTNANEKFKKFLNKSSDSKTQVIFCLTHEQRRNILHEFPQTKNIHSIDKPIKRRELYSLLRGETDKNSEVKKILHEDLIRQKLKIPLHILLVDDSEDNRVLMTSLLQKIPCHVDIAENGVEALELSKKMKYDLTFMDIQMPIMDGHQAMREIRNYDKLYNQKNRYIVALSAFAFSDEIEHSYEAGCDYYLTKPIKKEKLMEVILLFIKSREILAT